MVDDRLELFGLAGFFRKLFPFGVFTLMGFR
jgi:hypothetical protein